MSLHDGVLLLNMPETEIKPTIKYLHPTWGADPEFFFARKNLVGNPSSIIGAEKILPKEGIITTGGKLIIDGIQAELNPYFNRCRQSFSYRIHELFQGVQRQIAGKRITINWNVLVKVTKKEMDSLSPDSKRFGCSPSLNAYGNYPQLPDASKYLYRSAGGHIHLGTSPGSSEQCVINMLKDGKEAEKIVKILDIIVGNTCVLLDRDEGEIERRKYYGRAGEYRIQPHGIEYRVLGNFWLKNYTLMSMVMGLCRQGLGFAENKKAGKELMAAVNELEIVHAINNNDFNLALANFNRIKPIIIKWCPNFTGHSLNDRSMPAFEKFIEKGIKKSFRGDPLKHWSNYRFTYEDKGFEAYLERKS